MATPTTVLGGLLAVYQADNVLPTLAPAFWTGQAPENTPLPYLVLEHQGEEVQWNSEGGIEETRCTLHAFCEGAAACEAIVGAIRTAYDFVRLSLDGVADMGVMRTGYTLVPDERAGDADLVYHAAVSFLVRVYRTRTR
jgi:Protein of unknown function (DUF3168)